MAQDVSTTLLRATPTLFAALLVYAAGCESKRVPEPTPAPAPAPVPVASASAPGSASAATPSDSASSEPSSLPKGSPRFSWKAPLSVSVEEDVDQQGQHMQFAYHLDVCPGDAGTVLVSHRGVTVTQVNGVPTAGKERTAELRQIEAAASALPTMIIDRSGAFVRGTGYAEMIKRAATVFPGEEFADLRAFMASGQAPAILDVTLAQLWQSWVGVWLRFDPAHGASQEATDRDAGPGASRISMSYGGLTPEGHVKLAAHRVPTKDELLRLAGATGSMDPAQAASISQAAVLDWNTETEWPDIRPARARSRRSATMTVQGKEQTVAEDHVYRFDWRPGEANKPQCPAR
jgi:hypothetical protein